MKDTICHKKNAHLKSERFLYYMAPILIGPHVLFKITDFVFDSIRFQQLH
ncbi:hypothetical protein LX77_03283 [Gelidibacter algens]|uniref:Uncharacterized protein n=1 Tax=Gelidibacter algens TaxID=49280 RepID=A0A327RS98_9FLAO|nr:hypothetical protein LX77_03283 [Gelidibacter algens]